MSIKPSAQLGITHLLIEGTGFLITSGVLQRLIQNSHLKIRGTFWLNDLVRGRAFDYPCLVESYDRIKREMDFMAAKPDHCHVTYHIYMNTVQHAYGTDRLTVKGLNKNLRRYNLAVPFSKSCLFNASGKIIKIQTCSDPLCTPCNRTSRSQWSPWS